MCLGRARTAGALADAHGQVFWVEGLPAGEASKTAADRAASFEILQGNEASVRRVGVPAAARNPFCYDESKA